MNLVSAFVFAAIIILLVLAVRHLVKKGACAACGNVENCQGSSGDCGENSVGCPHSGACHPK